MLCLWVYCSHPPSVVWSFFSRQTKLVLTLRKITNRQCLKNAENSKCSSSNGCPTLTTMTKLSAGFPATLTKLYAGFPATFSLCGTSNMLLGQPRSHLLRCPHLFVDCEEWFCILLGSLPGARRAIVCILFSLERLLRSF